MTAPTTLLDGGRTAHSALKSPLNIQSNETPTYNISKNSAMTKILQQCNLIVWDEFTMAHKIILGCIRQNYERSTVNASGWTQCMFNFWPISIFVCYCEEKILIIEKLRKLSGKLENLRIPNHQFDNINFLNVTLWL